MENILDYIEKKEEKKERGKVLSALLILLFAINGYYLVSSLMLLDESIFFQDLTEMLFVGNTFIYLICAIGMWCMNRKTIFLFIGNILLSLWIAYVLWAGVMLLLSGIYMVVANKFLVRFR